MSKLKLVREFVEYIKSNNKLWLIPILIIIGLVVIGVLVSQSSALAPFIYALF